MAAQGLGDLVTVIGVDAWITQKLMGLLEVINVISHRDGFIKLDQDPTIVIFPLRDVPDGPIDALSDLCLSDQFLS